MKPVVNRAAPSPAEAAYNAFCETQNWKESNGVPVLRWCEVKPDLQSGWEAAARSAILWIRVRDRFAQGALSALNIAMDCDPAEVAYTAYQLAEAMMQERKRRWEQRQQSHQKREGQ